jgi:hypothetical protein
MERSRSRGSGSRSSSRTRSSRDFALYSPLVRPGGMIAFHDVWPGEFAGGSPRFWREIRDGYEWQELVESREQQAYGIGVLRLP